MASAYDEMINAYLIKEAKCTEWAQKIAARLGQPVPQEFCFEMDLGMAEVDGKQQNVVASVSVAPDRQKPEVWILVEKFAVVCPELGQNSDQPVYMETTGDVIAFIDAARHAMLKPLVTIAEQSD